MHDCNDDDHVWCDSNVECVRKPTQRDPAKVAPYESCRARKQPQPIKGGIHVKQEFSAKTATLFLVPVVDAAEVPDGRLIDDYPVRRLSRRRSAFTSSHDRARLGFRLYAFHRRSSSAF